MAREGTLAVGDTVRHPDWPKGETATIVSISSMPSRMGRVKGRYKPTEMARVCKLDRAFGIGEVETDDHWMESGLHRHEIGTNCSCIAQIEEDTLRPQGFDLDLAFVRFGNSLSPRPYIGTHVGAGLTKKRGKKPPIMLASYCPFCGTAYPKPEATLVETCSETQQP